MAASALPLRKHLAAAAALAALAALALADTVVAAPQSAAGVRFDLPTRGVQGNTVAATVRAPNGARCSLRVTYANGARQKGLGMRKAVGGRARWSWKVSQAARPGAAMAVVSCGAAGGAVRTIMIVGQIVPAHIAVVKTGYNLRVFPYGGSDVSYGVILRNDSARDAVDVTVLANFVMPDNVLIGSATTHVSSIAAGREHALGGDLMFVGVPPLARLEVVITIGDAGPPSRAFPAVANVRVVQDAYDPGWVGTVQGEIQNDQATRTLQSVEMSCVVFDAAGAIIGGGSGFTFGSLPPGAREFFKLQNGFRAIPFPRAASAQVSIVPTYKTS
jgi:hypothetical protein